MSNYTIFLIIGSTAAATGLLVLGFAYRRLQEHMRTLSEHQQVSAHSNGSLEAYEKLGQEFIDVSRALAVQDQRIESLSLKYEELKGLVEKRYHQLRMKIYRDGLEGEEEEPTAPDDVREALEEYQQQFTLEEPPPTAERRRRLRRKRPRKW